MTLIICIPSGITSPLIKKKSIIVLNKKSSFALSKFIELVIRILVIIDNIYF